MAETKKKPAAAKPAKPATKKTAATTKPTKTSVAKAAVKPAVKAVKNSAVKKSVAKKSVSSKPNKISAEERYRMVEVAAYFMAERNKFAGSPVEYWSAAEAQIKKMLS
jgi:hypothetical protein